MVGKDNFWVFVDFDFVKLQQNILSSLETAHVYHKSSHITHTGEKLKREYKFSPISMQLLLLFGARFILSATFCPLF